MKRRWIRAAAAILVTLTMIVPSYGATVTANGTQLSSQQAWVEKGTSFITLRTFAALTPYALSWDGTTAHLTGAGLNLQARRAHAAPYILAGNLGTGLEFHLLRLGRKGGKHARKGQDLYSSHNN